MPKTNENRIEKVIAASTVVVPSSQPRLGAFPRIATFPITEFG
jgi:hypothetical protein